MNFRSWFAIVLMVFGAVGASSSVAEEVAAKSRPLPPDKVLSGFTLPDDLEIQLMASEPEVRQPLYMSFDERGRLWVVQYLQYPDPAGLKRLSRDTYWRTQYDKVPPPPPNHFVGKDKITIHEDTDGDGKFDLHKTFVDGLNIATAAVKGRGGVWVLNPPYLLFYPDQNNDDVPDGDPVVHLEGFGLEDTHSVTNSLCWGPDGWLYAAQGSTVSGAVKRYGTDEPPVRSMGQHIWRYHPETRRYEIFAEGGGNAFGVEIDDKGRVFSGHNGGDTRGFHYVQGGYSQKGFTKHGPLSNPYAFGFFPAMKHPSVPRFTHTFLVYGGAALPQNYHGKLFGVAPLLNHVVYSDIQPHGSTFQTMDLGHAPQSSDPWFRPVDIKAGPDGGIYIADWCDSNISHLETNVGHFDAETGRIYRLRAKGAAPATPVDYRAMTTAQLVELLSSPNKWVRQTALRLIGDRRDPEGVPLIEELLASSTGQTALEALWALNLSGALDESKALGSLEHSEPFVRLWTVRLMGDARAVSPALSARLAEIATTEPSVEVRSQLASTAKRLPAGDALPIVRGLLGRDEDATDPHVPLLVWWALESKANSDRDAILKMFEDQSLWSGALVKDHILSKLMRRYAATDSRKDLLTCARLLELSPEPEHSKLLMAGFEEAYQGRSLAGLPEELVTVMTRHGGDSLVLGIRQGKAEAVEAAVRTIADESGPKPTRLQYIQIFGEVKQPTSIPVLLDLIARTSTDDELKMAALTSLQLYDDPSIAPAVIQTYAQFSPDVLSVAQTLLVSREARALELLDAVDRGQIDAASLPRDVVRQITVHRDPRIPGLVAKHWGTIDGATTAQMQEQILRLEAVVHANSSDPYNGKKLFNTTCAKCHRLFEQGGQIGPDLTTYKREDLASMLLAVVNPSAQIREGFETFLAITDDGRAVSGFLVDRDNEVLVLRGADGQNVTLAVDEIEEMAAQPRSLMPEGQLNEMTDQQIADLFAYLRSTQPLNN